MPAHAFIIRILPVLLLILSATLPSPPSRADTLPDFVRLVQDNGKAVVNVSSTRAASAQEEAQEPGPEAPEAPNDNPFDEYFRRFQQPPSAEQVRSVGSGFILSSDGYVLTNAHVAKDSESLMVRLSDRRELRAELIGLDERSDVALLKIDAPNLPTVKIGNSDALSVGEWVLAIGSPFGLEHTATQGIVSALGRNLPAESYVPFIQTDVAVNPGNSGGPLFNARGEVVGINSQIFSNTGGYMGLSFAIPINVAMDVVEQLKRQGHVTRGWLGVTVQPLDQSLAEAFGMDRPRGALVARVTPKSPAAKAGLRTGDVILRFGGKAIDETAQLPVSVAQSPVGKAVTVTILRGGQTRDVAIVIGELDKADAATQKSGPKVTENAQLGIVVSDVPPLQREALELAERGVLVQKVVPGPAADAGIAPGDIILQIEHSDVTSVQRLSEIVEPLARSATPVPVLVQRGETPLFLALRLSPDR